MTETPQPHQQPEPARHQQPWVTQPAPAAQSPLAPPGQPAGGRKSRGRSTIAVAAVAAVVAAAVSGGTTAIVLGAQDDPTPVASAPAEPNTPAPKAPVKQADPAAPDWQQTAAAVAPSVVSIAVGGSEGEVGGSGVILDSEGHVLTNNHVVASAGSDSVQVTLHDDRTYAAEVVGTDPSTDLAVLQLDNAPDDLVPATLGNSDDVKSGQPVMAVGNPLGLAGSVTTGIVSAVDRPVTSEAAPDDQGQPNNPAASSPEDLVVTNAIQTDAAVNPGNSGGPLVDAGGRVIGINSSIVSLSQGSEGQAGNIGLGFAIPVNQAKHVAEQLIDSGQAEHAFLGVGIKDGSVSLNGAERAAAIVQDVSSGTPADDAGLEDGDAVIALDGQSIDGAASLTAQIRAQAVGDTVTLTIVRDGQQQAVTVTLAAADS